MKNINSMLAVTAKLGLAAATIGAVAWMFVVYQPDGSVSSSQADILDLNFIRLSETARFASGLKQLGHDQPQTFSINDNIVSFSTNESRKRPAQLVREYQEEFVHQGLNRRIWGPEDTFGSQPDMFLDAASGGVVPINVSDSGATMGGMLSAGGAKTAEELMALYGNADPKLARIFTGYRAIQMQWDPERRRTHVTATWADDKFDYANMLALPGEPERKAAVPTCPGCSVVSRISNLDASKGYTSRIFTGERSQPELLSFYRRTLPAQGWEETESSITFNLLRPYVEFEGDEVGMLQFARGTQFLTLTGFGAPDGKTVVHTTISN